MSVIRIPLTVGKYVLITGINYRYDNRFLEYGSYIRNVLITNIHCTNLFGEVGHNKVFKIFCGPGSNFVSQFVIIIYLLDIEC